jgi:hypothetical protein
MHSAIKSEYDNNCEKHPSTGSHTVAHPSIGIIKFNKRRATYSLRKINPKWKYDENTENVADDKDALQQWKLMSQEGVANNGNKDDRDNK